MQAARAERRVAIARPQALRECGRRGAPGMSRSLQVWKTDSMRWRMRRQVRAASLGLVASAGPHDGRPSSATAALELLAGIALVADDVSPPRSARGRSSSATSRSGRSAPTQLGPPAECRRGRRQGAGASPRNSASGCGSSRSRQRRPEPSGGRSPASVRTRPASSRAAAGLVVARALRRRRRRPATRSPRRSRAAALVVARPGREGTGTDARAGAGPRAGSAGPRGCP